MVIFPIFKCKNLFRLDALITVDDYKKLKAISLRPLTGIILSSPLTKTL